MAEITLTPQTAQQALDRAQAGDELVFQPGRYRTRLTVSGKSALVLRGQAGAVLTSEVSAENFREEANRRSKEVQDHGKYPGLYPWLIYGQLVLRNCDQVTIVALEFEQSWPTHIAIENCQDIEILICHFTDGTFAIGAEGSKTYGIRVDHCTWTQDRPPGRIWRKIPWRAIHGAPPDDPPVDIATDWRLFDGDFFRGNDIAGGVTISNCLIKQAFNAIHCFNPTQNIQLGRDFHVHNCKFVEIRDNILEPEKVAQNWWFHHNVILNGHKWFSFELVRARFIYLFANLAWFTSIQGPSVGDIYRGGGVFKPNEAVDNPHGPIYVFNNSMAIRSDYLRRGILPGLKQRNNAICACRRPVLICAVIRTSSEISKLCAQIPRSASLPTGRLTVSRWRMTWSAIRDGRRH
jgi:hypothetical protein